MISLFYYVELLSSLFLSFEVIAAFWSERMQTIASITELIVNLSVIL